MEAMATLSQATQAILQTQQTQMQQQVHRQPGDHLTSVASQISRSGLSTYDGTVDLTIL